MTENTYFHTCDVLIKEYSPEYAFEVILDAKWMMVTQYNGTFDSAIDNLKGEN